MSRRADRAGTSTERGSATVLLLGVIGVVWSLAVAGFGLTSATVASHRAAAAADLAALAGALVLRDTADEALACPAAAASAGANAATLVGCRTSADRSVTVACQVPVGLRWSGLPRSAIATARAGPALG